MQDWVINSVSEDCLLVEWKAEWPLNHTSPTFNKKLSANIAAVTNYLLEHYAANIINVTPAYRTLLVQFDVLTTNESVMLGVIEQTLSDGSGHVFNKNNGTLHEIPVLYDASVAADLDSVCAAKGVSLEQLIERHTSTIYDVYAVGFMPGFAYLGYLPEIIQMPRHTLFRGSVPAGSVGIADRQTAVYPSESPGGWQIIGRTSMAMLDKNQSLLQVGDQVRFYGVDRDEFETF